MAIPVPSSKKTPSLTLQDKICLENILCVSKSFNNLSLSVFNTWFVFSSDQHSYETSTPRSAHHQGNLIKLFHRTNTYKYSIHNYSDVESWNKIQKQSKNT